MYETLELTMLGGHNYRYYSHEFTWEVKPEGVHIISKPEGKVSRFYPVHTLIECSFEIHEK